MLNEHTLQLTAAALGRQYKINVVFDGDQAFTNGRTIVIPQMAIPQNKKQAQVLLAKIRGYIDHEASHLRWTEFGIMKSQESPEHHDMTNILEDIRVEKQLGKFYPGCKENLAELVKILKAEKEFGFGDRTLINALMGFTSFRLRSEYLKQDIADLAEQARQGLQKYLTPEAIQKAEEIMDRIKAAQSTKDCSDIAAELLKVFNDSQSHKAEKTEENSEESGSPDGSKGIGGSSEKPDGSGGSQTENDPDGESGSSPGEKDQIINLPNGQITIGDVLKDSLQSIAKDKDDSQRSTIAHTAGSQPADTIRRTTRINVRQAQQLAQIIRAATLSYLEAQSLEHRRLAATGRKLNSRKLYKTETPDPKIFRRIDKTRQINTDIFLVLDRSGSMKEKDKQIWASTTVLAMALAYQSIRGLHLTALAFPGNHNNSVIILSDGSKVDPEKFRINAGGGTPMVEPLNWIQQQVIEQPNDHKKLVFVITDGDPNDNILTRNKITELMLFVDRVFLIGIKGASKQTLEYLAGPQGYAMVEDIATLPRKLSLLLRKNLR